MSVSLLNFPVSAIVDGLLSYLQYIFGNTDITPLDYRWNQDDRQSRIRICAPFVIDNAKPMSAPFIVVERGGFEFENRILDNLKNADANTFENAGYVAIANGTVNIICGSKEGPEASSIANYLAIMMQADRHQIINNLKFVRNLYHIDVSPEVPVVKDTEIRRWEVTLRMFVSLQMGWLKAIQSPVLWKSATMWGTDKSYTSQSLSEAGATTLGSDLLVDSTQDFGIYTTNNPQLLEQELSKNWYYIRFDDDPTSELYTIIELIDNHTLRLQTHDINNNPVAWSAPSTKTGIKYSLLWNNIHLKMEVPNAQSA